MCNYCVHIINEYCATPGVTVTVLKTQKPEAAGVSRSAWDELAYWKATCTDRGARADSAPREPVSFLLFSCR